MHAVSALCIALAGLWLLDNGAAVAQQTGQTRDRLRDILYNQDQQLAKAEKRQDRAYFQRQLSIQGQRTTPSSSAAVRR